MATVQPTEGTLIGIPSFWAVCVFMKLRELPVFTKADTDF